MKKLLSLVSASMLVLSAIMVFNVSPVSAQGPYIGIFPPQITDKKSPDTFTIKINISSSVPFAGYQFYLYWNRIHINATGMTSTPPGAWTAFSTGQGLKWDFNATHGRIERAVLDASTPLVTVTGTFTVATITFKVIQDSSPPTVVPLILRDTLIGDSTAANIPHTEYDGAVTVTGVAPPEAKHDISLVSVNASWPYAYPGRIVNFTVVIKNSGTFVEILNVTAYRNTTLIDKIPVTNLGAGENKTIIFQWNTSGLTPFQVWTISINATLAGDANPGDNVLVYGTVKIAMLGDVNADRVINLKDLIEVAKVLGAVLGSWAWNPQADIYPDGHVDIFDLVLTALRFGRHY